MWCTSLGSLVAAFISWQLWHGVNVHHTMLPSYVTDDLTKREWFAYIPLQSLDGSCNIFVKDEQSLSARKSVFSSNDYQQEAALL